MRLEQPINSYENAYSACDSPGRRRALGERVVGEGGEESPGAPPPPRDGVAGSFLALWSNIR